MLFIMLLVLCNLLNDFMGIIIYQFATLILTNFNQDLYLINLLYFHLLAYFVFHVISINIILLLDLSYLCVYLYILRATLKYAFNLTNNIPF
jgi:hypothetical protein